MAHCAVDGPLFVGIVGDGFDVDVEIDAGPHFVCFNSEATIRRVDRCAWDIHGVIGAAAVMAFGAGGVIGQVFCLSLIHISEPTRPPVASRMPSSA